MNNEIREAILEAVRVAMQPGRQELGLFQLNQMATNDTINKRIDADIQDGARLATIVAGFSSRITFLTDEVKKLKEDTLIAQKQINNLVSDIRALETSKDTLFAKFKKLVK